MAITKKISELTAISGGVYNDDDLFEVSYWTGSAFVSRKILGSEIIATTNNGLYAQTVLSATLTNTTVETSIVGTGVGSLTFSKDTFQVGDSFHAKIGGVISALNNDEITINIKTGATTLATTGLISLESVTELGWECELDFTIATIGAFGSICTNGNFAYNRNTGSLEGYVFQDVQAIDTTASNTLDITATWNQAKTQDQVYSANFVLYKVY